MNNNKLLYIIIALLIIIIGGGAYFLFFGKNDIDTKSGDQPENTSQAPAASSDEELSEQPNQEKFNEYFTEAYLAKLPAGAEFNPWQTIKTKTFSAGEQFCTILTMKKQIPANTLSSVIYDINVKQDTQPRGGPFPQALGPGGSTGCEPLSQPTGKYEYKIYLNDVLVIVLPFEVK
jgi:hypothetical protein